MALLSGLQHPHPSGMNLDVPPGAIAVHSRRGLSQRIQGIELGYGVSLLYAYVMAHSASKLKGEIVVAEFETMRHCIRLEVYQLAHSLLGGAYIFQLEPNLSAFGSER